MLYTQLTQISKEYPSYLNILAVNNGCSTFLFCSYLHNDLQRGNFYDVFFIYLLGILKPKSLKSIAGAKKQKMYFFVIVKQNIIYVKEKVVIVNIFMNI